jgi:hypothetical protein
MIKKAAQRLKEDNERGARQAILEDLFYDFHKSRKQVYYMNFVRGLFFGVGSIIGGTLVVAIVLGLLGLLVDIPGGVGEFIRYIVDLVKQNQAS